MKKFKAITITGLSAITILIAANIWYLRGLYESYKEKYIEQVESCVRQADIISWIKIMNSTFGVDDSHMTLSLTLSGDSTKTEWYDYPDVDRRMVEELISAFAYQGEYDEKMTGKNYTVIDDVFRKQLDNAGLHPEFAVILPPDSTLSDDSGLWKIRFTIDQGNTHLYNVYISSLGNEVLKQMSGIIATSASILIVMSFLIGYLLRWVGRLRTIEQMKDDFTHNMTHELKTPVAVAYSAADSMLRYYDHSDEERNKQFLKIIMQRLGFLSGMIENILSMSMERFKTMKLNIETVDIKPIVNEVSGMMKLKADKPVKINIDIPENICVQADSLHFGNIMSNLIDNAVKYSGDSVNITIKADTRSIAIADDGMGIDKADLPYIFDKFYRVVSGNRYEVGGYGLGLYYVRQIVALHGWSIDVSSKPGHGTEFTIKFKGNEEG